MLKLGFRLTIGIQHRLLVIPWVTKHSVSPRILCSEKRDYNSSGLSRYVPKKSREISEDSPEKGINASRWDHSVSGSKVKGERKEAREDMYMDLQERNDAESYMNVSSLDGSSEGVMSLEKGMTAGRWEHCVPRPKGNLREAGAGAYSNLQGKNDAGTFSNVSSDDSEEELEESSDDVRPTRQHKQAYDEIKLYMDAETAKSSKETQDAENMAIRYLGVRAYTAVELKKKLIGKKYPLEIVDRVINDFDRVNSGSQVLILKQKVKHLQHKLEETRADLDAKEAKIQELENSKIESELEGIFQRKFEAEIEHLLLTRSLQVVKEQPKKVVTEDPELNRGNMLGKTCKSSFFFLTQLILLVSILRLVLLQSSPASQLVIPT